MSGNGLSARAKIFSAFVLAAASAVFAQAPADANASAKFLGPQSCASSSCHGGAGQNRHQFTVWTTRDFHHERPYATLTTARSERIAEVLKIGDPTQSGRCTACHAPMQTIPRELLSKEIKITDGVSCENCHGAAQNWLRSHTRPDFSHADRVHAGMRDLKNLYVRANTCVACHQNVDSEILAAGHPELIFELDGQSVTQPKHWREKGDWSGAQAWLVGQAVALREMSWQLSREKAPTENAVNRWSGLLWLLQKASAALPGSPRASEPTKENIERVQSWSDELARAATEMEWSGEQTQRILVALASVREAFEDRTVPQPAQARRAERLVLALDRLVTGLPDAKRDFDQPFNKLFADAQSLPDFNPSAFAAHLQEFHAVAAAMAKSKASAANSQP